MLSIFLFLLFTVIFATISYKLIEAVSIMVVGPAIYNFTLGVAQDYLMTNGRGFFKERNQEAIAGEVCIRSAIICLIYVILVGLEIIFIKSDWAFWVVPTWSIKIGIIIGTVIEFLCSMIISLTSKAMIGSIMAISEDGVASFDGIWCDDFEVNLADYWEADEYPPLRAKFIVIKYLGYIGIGPLDFDSRE